MMPITFYWKKNLLYLPEGYDFAPVRKLRTKEVHPKYRIFTGITGFQLSNWYKNNRFCGRCGSKTVHSTTERALKCPSCGTYYLSKNCTRSYCGRLQWR